MRNAAPAAAAALALLVSGGAARAQATPDILDATIVGEQVNEAIERSSRAGVRTPGEDDGEIAGEAGVYVLQVNEIFSVSGSAGLGYTDNPSRTGENLRDSFYSDAAVTAGVSTVLGGAVDFGLFASAAGRQYFDAKLLSNRTVSGTLSLGTGIGGTPIYLSAVAFGGYSFDHVLENPTGFYGGMASVSAMLPLGASVAIRPGAGVTRQWSGVSENDSVAASASLDLLLSFTPNLSATVRTAVHRRWYDDFYEDVTFVERRDLSWEGGVVVSYRISGNAAVSLSGGYLTQDSTFFLSKYNAFDAVAAVSFVARF